VRYQITFTLEGKMRSVVVEDGSRIVRPPPQPPVDLPAAQAVWDALKQLPGATLLDKRPE